MHELYETPNGTNRLSDCDGPWRLQGIRKRGNENV